MIDNKYSKHYFRLVESRKNRVLVPGVYYEKHHILPKCFGGTLSKTNLVNLTAREHFIAHLLLTKCYSGIERDKMFVATYRMVHGRQNKYFKLSSRTFERVRQEHIRVTIERNIKRKHSNKTKEKIRASLVGKKHPRERVEINSAARRNIRHTNEYKEKMRTVLVNRNPYFYKIIFPTGKIDAAYSLKQYCKDNKLDYKGMCKVAAGKQHTCIGIKIHRELK